MKKLLSISSLAVIMCLSSGLVLSEDQEQEQLQDREQLQQRDQHEIYGGHLMTPKERAEHRAKMQSAKTMEEREQLRMDHHERMNMRAKKRGMSLPDDPCERRGGMMHHDGGKKPGGGGR